MWARTYLTCWIFPTPQTNNFSHQIQVIKHKRRVVPPPFHTHLHPSPCRLQVRRAFRKTSSDSWWTGSKSAWYDLKTFSLIFFLAENSSFELTANLVSAVCWFTGQHWQRRSATSAVAKDLMVVSRHFSGPNRPPAGAHAEPCTSLGRQEGVAGVRVWSQTFRYPQREPQPGFRGERKEHLSLKSVCHFILQYFSWLLQRCCRGMFYLYFFQVSQQALTIK